MIKELTTKGKYIVIDVESESLNLCTSRPWEVAYSIMEDGKIIQSYQKFLWFDDLNVSADAARVTGFNYKEYKEKAEDSTKVWNEFSKLLYNERLIFHNGLNFDIYQIKNWAEKIKKWKGFSFTSNIIDTNALAKAFFSGDKPDFKNFLSWQYKWLNLRKKGLKSNLAYCCKEFGIEVDETKTHIGSYDTFLTGEVFKQLVYRFQES